MKNINKYISVLCFAWFGIVQNAIAYPLETNGFLETAENKIQTATEVQSMKSEIDSTQNYIKQTVLAGVPGYLNAVVTGNWSGLATLAAGQSYAIFQAEKAKKQKAKEAAQKEADEKAQELALAKQEGEEAAEEAVDENRKTAADNRKKRFLNFAKQKGSALAKQKAAEGLNKLLDGSSAGQTINQTLGVLQN